MILDGEAWIKSRIGRGQFEGRAMWSLRQWREQSLAGIDAGAGEIGLLEINRASNNPEEAPLFFPVRFGQFAAAGEFFQILFTRFDDSDIGSEERFWHAEFWQLRDGNFFQLRSEACLRCFGGRRGSILTRRAGAQAKG